MTLVYRSRKQPTSPTNGFTSGPLRSASCAVVSAAAIESKPKEIARPDRESFKRSHSVSESISRADDSEYRFIISSCWSRLCPRLILIKFLILFFLYKLR